MKDTKNSDGRPGAFSSSPKTRHEQNEAEQTPVTPAQKPAGGLLSNFVQQTDNDFNGVDDPSLIGQDMADDLFDEDGEPIEDEWHPV